MRTTEALSGPTALIGGCPLSRVGAEDLVEAVGRWVAAGRECHSISAINVTKLVMMQSDAKLASSILESSATIADGYPVYAALKLLGDPVPERITGVDLLDRLLGLADREGLSLFFFGARQDVLDEVLRRCRAEHPGASIVGSRNGYFEAGEEAGIIQQISDASADLLFLGLGLPQKEHFLADHRKSLNAGVILPVGGGFDVFAGRKRRAPTWAQRLGVEWLWRSIYDLSRARLVLRGLVPFARIVARDGFRRLKSGKQGA